MRPLVPLAVVYLLVAALLVPGSPLAAEEPETSDAPAQPDATGQPPADQAPPPAPEAGAEPPVADPPAADPAVTDPPAADPPAAAPGQPPPAAPPAGEVAAPKADTSAVTGRRKRSSQRSASARAAATAGVTIRDFAYAPATISVDAGDTVNWTNRDSADHTATGDDFDTGVLAEGQSGSFTFRDAGTFSYVCTIHPNMKGTVRVAAAAQEQAPETEGEGAQESGDQEDGGTGAAQSPSSGGPSLPRSGAEEGWLAALGALLLVAGFAARRRANAG
jgi:plastocyanin